MDKKLVVRHTWLFVILVMLVVYIPCNSEVGLMTNIEKSYFAQQTGYITEIDKVMDIRNESNVLYLDAGVAPYYFGINSSARYICPLPFQRDAPDWNLSGNYAFQQTYRDILAYNGTYIISEKIGEGDWIHSKHPNRKPLMDKLDKEYEVVWDTGWTIYKKK